MLPLQPEETIIKEFDYLFSVITNQRVIYKKNRTLKSIPLSDIKTYRIQRGKVKLYAVATIAGILLMELFVFTELIVPAIISCAMSVVFLCMYFFRKKSELVIYGAKGKMSINIRNLRENKVRSFMNAIDLAKRDPISL